MVALYHKDANNLRPMPGRSFSIPIEQIYYRSIFAHASASASVKRFDNFTNKMWFLLNKPRHPQLEQVTKFHTNASMKWDPQLAKNWF